ncbi:Molybdopterin or thiamine biosynthesis adenylyltransferase [Paracoccus halophilus]|uniref:Molybdopterin or thiamine biosynthesis adenylyltransferase n=1 Tax=Paracoccus halophilus TaxID=376733 RepID=A0A099F2H7_9RHOB|nr:HesA/MoeB/ThiF family protein [Paracoccus halophilus]KGJ04392.1 thiamine biosynthesis protein ThiF [Paracoccus halophilus]SFA54899.1 Molybdopterin or thiamine biosynthesis adenylyltransferase [Paracoccus halophilus]
MSRYLRQMVLPEMGAPGQARIAAAHLLVVGAGALGVPVLQYLAGAGIGHITLIDPDTVEESNLHRQPLYRMKDIGQAKVRAAAQAVARLNPEVGITALVDRLTPANAPALIAQADLVLDCADSYAASYTLSDACLPAGKPLISASALGIAGYVGGFCGTAPSLRALFPDPPDSGQTCATAGVLGPVVGMLGCLQAQMALSVLLGLSPSPLGQFIRYEGGRFTQFRFDRAPENPGPRFIAREEITRGDMVIDLRPEDEAPHKATATALRIPGYGETGPLPAPDQRLVLACRSGLRSWCAADALSRRWSGEITLLALGEDN